MAKAGKKAPTKSQLFADISEATGVAKKDVAAVFTALSDVIKTNIGKNGPGAVQIPGLVKVVRKKVPARPARKGVMMMGQLRDVAARPASVKVSVRALKGLKDFVK